MSVINSLDVLFPPFAERTKLFADKAKQIDFFVYETYRSFESQMELYKKGRELQNGIWVVVDNNLIVTKAKPGMSLHAYGLAFDAIPDGDCTKQGVQWSWKDVYVNKDGKTQKVDWKGMGKLSKSLGNEWAGDWIKFSEYPHSQDRYGYLVSDLYSILTTEGLDAVWKKLYIKVKPAENVVPVTVEIPKAPIQEVPKPIHVVSAEELDVKKDEPKDTIWSLLLKLVLALFKK